MFKWELFLKSVIGTNEMWSLITGIFYITGGPKQAGLYFLYCTHFKRRYFY